MCYVKQPWLVMANSIVNAIIDTMRVDPMVVVAVLLHYH